MAVAYHRVLRRHLGAPPDKHEWLVASCSVAAGSGRVQGRQCGWSYRVDRPHETGVPLTLSIRAAIVAARAVRKSGLRPDTFEVSVYLRSDVDLLRFRSVFLIRAGRQRKARPRWLAVTLQAHPRRVFVFSSHWVYQLQIAQHASLQTRAAQWHLPVLLSNDGKRSVDLPRGANCQLSVGARRQACRS